MNRRQFVTTLGTAACTVPARAIASPPALVVAAEAGDLAALRRLLAAGTPVDVRDGAGRTALLAATQRDQVEAARLLIERGADVNAKDALQDSAFLYAGAEEPARDPAPDAGRRR